MVHLHKPLNPPLIQSNVLFRRNGHERIRRARLCVERGLQFPFTPAVVVFRYSETKRGERFGPRKFLVSPFSCEESGQKGVIRLADKQQLVALFPDDQAAFPTGGFALDDAFFREALQLSSGVAKPVLIDVGIMLPQRRSNPAHFAGSLA